MEERQKINFSGANLRGANLRRADLSGANLSGANELEQEQLDQSIRDVATQLPKRLVIPRSWGSSGDSYGDLSTTSSFTFYNSWWRNLALTVLFGLISVLCIPVGFDAIFRDEALLVEFGVLGFGVLKLVGTLVLGFRLFDRRLKVKIDADGIHDYRSSFGNIP